MFVNLGKYTQDGISGRLVESVLYNYTGNRLEIKLLPPEEEENYYNICKQFIIGFALFLQLVCYGIVKSLYSWVFVCCGILTI